MDIPTPKFKADQKALSHYIPSLYANGRNILLATLTAIILFAATSYWVPLAWKLNSVASRIYSMTSLHDGLKPRSLVGTIVHLLHLSPYGYILLLHVLKFLWIGLLSFELYRHLRNKWLAFCLSALFTGNFLVYITNYHAGFVDIATHFWLLLAATLLRAYVNTSTQSLRFFCLLALCLALLTHEIAVFGIGVLMLWSWLRCGCRYTF